MPDEIDNLVSLVGRKKRAEPCCVSHAHLLKVLFWPKGSSPEEVPRAAATGSASDRPLDRIRLRGVHSSNGDLCRFQIHSRDAES
jgi:hypothetical protein